MKKALFIFSAAALSVSCRTTQARNTSETQSNASAPAAATAAEVDEEKILLELSGRTAKNLYGALDIAEVNLVGGGSKRVEGKIDISCVGPYSSQIPAGAQGMSSLNHAECEVLKLPDQVIINGIIAPQRLATLRGKLADQFYASLEVIELESFPTQKQFRGKAEFGCSYALVSGGAKKYSCSLISKTDSPDDNSSNDKLVSLKGEAAQKTWQLMNVGATDSNTKKSWVGQALIVCTYSRGGGSLPPGVQGMPALPVTNCSVLDGSTTLPPGAQGIVGPHSVVNLDGDAAYNFYTAFAVNAQQQSAGKVTKRYNGKVDFTCSYDLQHHLSVDQAYRCEIVKKP